MAGALTEMWSRSATRGMRTEQGGPEAEEMWSQTGVGDGWHIENGSVSGGEGASRRDREIGDENRDFRVYRRSEVEWVFSNLLICDAVMAYGLAEMFVSSDYWDLYM
ncbi:hypothetical protein ZIOFF_009386 [Zingiber officinale]|uniref:Uncharacterized protein n=1 Tax=Zingiber officinale TaxID=94328 RepID=A0A8J5HFI5_ZINOF|nr:hypothetical protein ZIOFF_009386 [Zingiber officinale]